MLAARHAEPCELHRLEGSIAKGLPREKSARHPVTGVVSAALVVALLAAGFVGQRVVLMHLTYKLDAERALLRQVAQEHEQLRLQVERARSLDRIEALARGRLGMVSPTHRQMVVIPAPSMSQGTGTLSVAQAEAARAKRDGPGTGWLAALIAWTNERWPGNAAEAEERAEP